MEPSFFPVGLLALAVLVLAISVTFQRWRDRRPARSALPVQNVLGGPERLRTYMVLNDELIRQLYAQIPGATVQVEVQKSRRSDFRLKPLFLGLFGLEGGTGSDHTEKQLIPPLTDPVQATGAVERYLQSTEGLAFFDLTAPGDEGPITVLLEKLGTDAGRIGLTVPDEVKDGLRRAWQGRRQRIPDDPASLRGHIRIRAEFAVQPGVADGDRVLTAGSHHDSGPLQVRIRCAREHIRPSFDETSDTVAWTCLGKPTWRKDERVLDVLPVSIHDA